MVDEIDPAQLRDLLGSVEEDTSRTSPQRAVIRTTVMATFDEAGGAVSDRDGEILVLTPTGQATETPSSPDRSRRMLAWAAAIAACVLLVVMFAGSNEPPLVETAVPPAARFLELDGVELPVAVPVGTVVTDLIGNGLSFDAPAGLVVVNAADGMLTLAVAEGAASSTTGQLVFVELQASDWQAELASLAQQGQVNVKEIGVTVDGRSAIRFDVSITNAGLAARNCGSGQPCMGLGGGAPADGAVLWAGADNRVVEIGRRGDSMVLAIETSQQFQGPLSRLAAELVTSASLSD
jgi:hypothetical protein